SPLYQKYARGNASMRPQAFGELQERTGIDPEQDLETVVLAGSRAAGGPGEGGMGLAFVTGTFDRGRISRSIEDAKRGVSWKQAHGTTVYMFNEGSNRAGAFAFLDDHTLVIGEQKSVEATVADHADGRSTLRSNTALMGLLEQLKPGSTFWMVGDQTL